MQGSGGGRGAGGEVGGCGPVRGRAKGGTEQRLEVGCQGQRDTELLCLKRQPVWREQPPQANLLFILLLSVVGPGKLFQAEIIAH